MNRIIKIWSIPSTTYCPTEKQFDSFTLEDNFDPTNQSLVKYKFNNTTQEVSSWVEMYIQIVKTLHLQDNTILYKVANDINDEYGLSKYIKYSNPDLKKYIELDDNLFVYVKADNYFKLSLLRKFFSLFDISQDELILYLDPKKDQ